MLRNSVLSLVCLASTITCGGPDYLERLASGIHLSMLILKDPHATTTDKEKAWQDLKTYTRQAGYKRAKKLLSHEPHPEEIIANLENSSDPE